MPAAPSARGWGSVARRGAGQVRTVSAGRDEGRREEGRDGERRSPAPFVPERFERVDEVPTGGSGPSARPSPVTPKPAELAPDLVAELAAAAGPEWGRLRATVTQRLQDALGAFQRERYRDAARMLRPVVDAVPTAPSPRELLGLAQYRQGQWRAARGSLETVAQLTGSADQHPVLMDCDRALGRHARVARRFEELRMASPDPEVLSEGRLVLAGTMADDGDVAGAVEMLVSSGAGKRVRNPAPRHLRQWYVLGDLSERCGDLGRARELFARVVQADPGAYDAADRLAQLGMPRRPRSSVARSGRAPKAPSRTPRAAGRGQ